MKSIVDKIRSGSDDITVFEALARAWGNPYALRPSGLQHVYRHGLSSDGPMLDVGSGLSTIVMGIAAEKSGVPVYALEDDAPWVGKLRTALADLGIGNVTVHHCAIEDGWYRLPDDLPEHFGLVLVDGPQHYLPDRIRVFDRIGERLHGATVLFDDVGFDAFGYRLHRWVIEQVRLTERERGFVVTRRAA